MTGRGSIYAQPREPTRKEHGNALYNRTPVQGPATANAVQCEDTNEGGKLTRCQTDSFVLLR